MKLAFISLMGGIPWGGSEELWYRTAKLALQKGHMVFVSVYNWGKDTHSNIHKLQKAGAQLHLRQRFSHDVPLGKKIRRYVANRIHTLNTNWRTLENFRPDYLLINQGGSFEVIMHHQDLLFKIEKNNWKYSLLCHSHDQYSAMPGPDIYPAAQAVFKKAKQVFVVSRRMAQTLQRQLAIKLSNIHLVKNPVNLNETKLLAWPEDDTIHMAMVGYVGNTKGHDIALAALARPDWKKRAWHLNIYGNGYAEKYIEDLATFYGIKDKIHLHGFVTDIKTIWRYNHILLIPSSGEGLPLTLIEAMLCGRPAVVTDVGGNTELIKERQNGFVADAPSIYSFGKALDRMWPLQTQLPRFGQQAHSEAQKFYSKHPELDFLNVIINI